ncbi:MAG TPA: 3-deoxy-D-manno-octulosonic acid transferase, partial [Nitratifractor sp.]|nr:3-deoxy-D-manno-octulosonic acid transferase [Nitratifractor sp.]
MFKYIYLFVVTLSYIVATPFLLLLRFKKKYKSSVPARFFLRDNPPFTENGVHFHVCSNGEAKAIKPLVEKFKDETLHFSAITANGFSVIKENSKRIRYMPFEIFLPPWLKRQIALLVVEEELW